MIPILTKDYSTPLPQREEGFIVLIHKETDWTSFDVVKKIRSFLRVKKAGHAGTLDPFATGLLIIGIGKGTKQLQKFSGLDKSYRAVIRFGIETDTYDRTGQIIGRKDISGLAYRQLKEAVDSIKGQISQIPPMFSAKKVNGVPLYRLARKKKEVVRKPVAVRIHKNEIISWEPPLLTVDLIVSKGTYIRSYAHDLGKLLGIGAHLQDLTRTAIDKFNLKSAFTIDEFIKFWNQTAS
ncbi:MAG TPA: tRNA pseudouridine(55) synthase TruB [Calditrichaeota bacterium]|nr:tRNA pseudouridine(55) synthase TruB [Calditrichota bacterium]